MRYIIRRSRIFFYVKNKSNLHLIVYLATMVFLCISVLLCDAKIRPIVKQMAMTRAQYIATKVINDAITDAIRASSENYGSLVTLDKDANDKITAVKTDMIKINHIKVEITDAILRSLSSIDTSQIGIPIGNIINGELLSGRGPRIPVKIVPLGVANASFISMFTSAGINQTLHKIILEAKVQISVLTPGASVSTEVTSQLVVSETIIVGVVPDTYTYIDDTEQSLLGKINDYSEGEQKKE